MAHPRIPICKLACALLLLAGTASPAFPEEENRNAAGPAAEEETVAIDEAQDATPEQSTLREAHILSGAAAGYRFVGTDGYGGRASKFEYLHSGPWFGLNYNRLGSTLKYSIDGTYLNDKEYNGEFLFDHQGQYRVSLRTESMFHNLDRDFLFSSFPNYEARQEDAPREFGVRVEQDAASFRYKPHDFAMHLNLGYWRMLKQGTTQLIYADQDFEGAANIVHARALRVDRQTHEGSAGVDAHLGPIDVAYLFRIRQFVDGGGIPADSFIARTDLSKAVIRNAGIQQHNEDPDSRLISHTVKLNTSLSGGIVGAATYSYGIRDNLSRLTDVAGANRASATLHNAATDFIYTPCKEFSFSLKYRLQQVNNDAPATVTGAFWVQPEMAVRRSVDLHKNTVTGTMSIRPWNAVSFIGDYQAAFTHRNNLSSDSELQWRSMVEDSVTHKGTFTIISRPVKGMRLKALYSYATTDHPSYGISAAQKHEGKLLATYNSANRWGVNASYQASREINNEIPRLQITSVTPVTFSPFPSLLSRDRSDDRVSGSVWFSPAERLTLNATYSFLRNNIDQGVLLTTVAPSVYDMTNYTSSAHVYAVGSTYNLSDRASLSVQLQQVRSLAEFVPGELTVGSGSTAGIRDISRTDTVESSVATRLEVKLTGATTCAFDYSFRDYNDSAAASAYNGTVQTYMVSLNARW